MTNTYELTNIKAIAKCAGDTEEQEAVLIHLVSDEFGDGDCILFGYTADSFENDDEVTTALYNETPESDYVIREDGVYIAY